MSSLHEHPDSSAQGANWSRINQWLLWFGLAAAVSWLFFRHNEHLLQMLPFLIILACPLMHLDQTLARLALKRNAPRQERIVEEIKVILSSDGVR